MRSITRTLALLATLAVVLPALAAARSPTTLAPPGNSAVWQYVEVVPNDAGASPPRAGGVNGGPLTPHQRRVLVGLGTGGRTLAGVVDATAPTPIRGSGPRPDGGAAVSAAETLSAGQTSPRLLSSAGARSPVSLILDAAVGGGNGGLGVLLPAIVLASAVGLATRALWKRRPGS